MEYVTLVLIILAAAVASNIIGAFWYSPFLFGKIWKRELGVSHTTVSKKQIMFLMLYAFLFDIVTACVFLFLLIVLGGSNPFVLALILWVGFIMPNLAGGSLFEKRSWKMFWITSSYRLVALFAMSLVFYLL